MLDIRLKLRSALLGFEHIHLQDQSLYAAQQIARQHRADSETIIKDVLTGISDCSPAARRLRYRLTAYVYEQAEHIGVVPQLPLTLKRITVSICSESTAANVEDLAGLARSLASAVIQVQGRDPAIATREDWLWTALIAPLSRSATKCPSNEAAATGSTVLCAALSVCTDWPDYAPATAAIRLALKAHLQFLSPGSPSTQVAQVFLPVQLAVAALLEGMSAATVTSVARVGLWGLTCKESWQVRKEAADTIAVLVKSVLLDSRDAAPGQYVLEGQQAALVIALQKVKYDKIQHVRHAVGRALAQLALAGKPTPVAVPVPVTRSSMKASSNRFTSAASSSARSSCSESTALEKAPPIKQFPVSAASSANAIPKSAMDNTIDKHIVDSKGHISTPNFKPLRSFCRISTPLQNRLTRSTLCRTTEHSPRRTLQNEVPTNLGGKPRAPVPMVNAVKKTASVRQRFVRPTGKMQQQTLDFGVELFLPPVTPPVSSVPSVPTLDLALLPLPDTRSVSAPGSGSEAQGHAERQSVADRDVLIADQNEGELDQPEVEPPICCIPAVLVSAAAAFLPSSAAASTAEPSTHSSPDLERVPSSPSRRALMALQPVGSGLDPGHRAGYGDGEITEDGIRLRMRPEVGELEVNLTGAPHTRPMSSLRARLVHGATGPELRVCLAMGASKSEPAIVRHYTCAAGVIRQSSEIATAAAAVPPSPTQTASTPAIPMQSNGVAGASPTFKSYHSPPSKPDHAAEQGETTSAVLTGVPLEVVLLKGEDAEFTAQLTSSVAGVTTPRGLAWEVALNQPCVPHPFYSPSKAAKNGVGLQQNHAARDTTANNASGWHQGTARGGSPERGAFPPSSEASQGPGGAHYAASRDSILDAAFMAEDSTPWPLHSTSPRLPSSLTASQPDVPLAPVLPQMGTLDRLERLMTSVGGESSELSALRVRIAAAVRRARTSGGALSGSAVRGSQHLEGLEPEIAESENGGNAGSRMGYGVDAKNDRSFVSALDELSMGDCSVGSSLNLSSPHYAQGQDIFCNPLWND